MNISLITSMIADFYHRRGLILFICFWGGYISDSKLGFLKYAFVVIIFLFISQFTALCYFHSADYQRLKTVTRCGASSAEREETQPVQQLSRSPQIPPTDPRHLGR